jgi:hypothetical protein
MPHFYFHLHDDMDVLDEEGIELPDLKAARERGIRYAVDMTAASVLERRKINLHHRIEVADESGQVRHVVEFGDVIRIEQ